MKKSMNHTTVKFYAAIFLLAMAVLTTLPQFLTTLKGLCIYIPYFTILCGPAILLFRRKMRMLHEAE